MPKKHPRRESFALGGIPPKMKSPAGKILITGSGGMLGIDLCRELSKDCEVYGVDLVYSVQCTVYRKKNFCKGDVTNRKNILRIIQKIKPDVVIHAAAMTDVDGCEKDAKKAYRVNARGAGNVAAACKAAGAVLIYISTDFVFDGKKKNPYKESDKPAPLGVYGDSKLEGEKAVIKYLRDHFIIRTSWLYGKNGKNFVDTILSKAKTVKVLKVVDDQVGSPTYTKDLAKAIHALSNKIFTSYELRVTSYGTYHVSNAGSVSWYAYAKEILKIKGVKTKVIPISAEELSRPAKRPAMSILDNSRFLKLTGYRMRPWKKALEEYLNSK